MGLGIDDDQSKSVILILEHNFLSTTTTTTYSVYHPVGLSFSFLVNDSRFDKPFEHDGDQSRASPNEQLPRVPQQNGDVECLRSS